MQLVELSDKKNVAMLALMFAAIVAGYWYLTNSYYATRNIADLQHQAVPAAGSSKLYLPGTGNGY